MALALALILALALALAAGIQQHCTMQRWGASQPQAGYRAGGGVERLRPSLRSFSLQSRAAAHRRFHASLYSHVRGSTQLSFVAAVSRQCGSMVSRHAALAARMENMSISKPQALAWSNR